MPLLGPHRSEIVIVTALGILSTLLLIRKFNFSKAPPPDGTETSDPKSINASRSEDSSSHGSAERSQVHSRVEDTPTVGYFPWEPNYKSERKAPTIQTKDTSFTVDSAIHERTERMHSPTVGGEEREKGAMHSCMMELDFLASMTFANGGLRAPSCPCCV